MPQYKIQKTFPADTSLQKETFLNNKAVDAELYAILQAYSVPKNGQTIVIRKNLPTQEEIAEMLGTKVRTVRNRINSLIEAGYVRKPDGKDQNKYYILEQQEIIFVQIPLKTLEFLLDTLKPNVIKVYIYLIQRNRYRPHDYLFTCEELAEHIGVNLSNNTRNYEMINNALSCLSTLGLITYTSYFDGKKPVKKLISVSLDAPGT